MQRHDATRLVFILVICGTLVATADGEVVTLQQRRFQIPAELELQLVAGPPLVMRPICAAFDELGNLYVADSSGSNANVQEQLKQKPHRVVRLSDSNGDGVFDQSTVYADHLMFPEGSLFHQGSLYVAAPPSIWKLTDTDGDGVADECLEWFDGKTLTGCANDLHGPYLGPDGWIYWCKGAFAEQTYDRPGRQPWSTRAAHIFRRRPEGGVIEPVMTGGMDNPVEVVFTPGGERIFSTTFLQHPADGRRDGLIHAVYGGVYGKIHSVIDDHPRTGGVMPVMTHLGAAAPCGLCLTESAGLGQTYRRNLFACSFNMHKVTRHILIEQDATFQTRDEDFLTCEDLDFHPTDVLEDADGSLLVIDTGGWYKLCCPTSQLQKPDVLGAIYRVRRKDASGPADPRGAQIDWSHATGAEMVPLLGDARPWVSRRAQAEIAKSSLPFPRELTSVILEHEDADTRRTAVWTSVRLSGPDARASVRAALADPDASVRQAAAHGVSVWRDAAAFDSLLQLLRDGSPHNQRVSAEALGRLRQAEAVPAILKALAAAEGRVLRHSLTYALIEIADAPSLRHALRDDNVTVRAAAMIALDQMSPASLSAEDAVPLLLSDEPTIRETASWIVSEHPRWANDVGRLLQSGLREGHVDDEKNQMLLELVPRLAENEGFQGVVAELIGDRSLDTVARRQLVGCLARSRVQRLPRAWADCLSRLLTDSQADLARDALNTLSALPRAEDDFPELNRNLVGLAQGTSNDPHLRLKAAAVIPGGLPEVSPDLFALLRGQLSQDHALDDRQLAVQALVSAQLSEPQRSKLLDDIRTVGPMELGPLLETFKQTKNAEEGLQLVAALAESVSASALPPAIIADRVDHFGPEVQARLEQLLKRFEVDTAGQRTRLNELLQELQAGDIRRGQRVFHSTKAACAACHAMGYLGGKIGPDLTRIGKIRSRRDLLEAIVFPNVSFVRSYEPLTVTTRNGKVLNGVVREDGPQGITLIDSQRRELRIPRAEIDETLPGKISVMPSGLDQQLTPTELADLLAFLQDAK